MDQTVNVPRTQVRLFYQPLILLETIGPIRAPRTKAESPQHEDHGRFTKSCRHFVDALAYFCANTRDPDHVVAVALGRGVEKVKVLIAANSHLREKVEDFLKDLLHRVRLAALSHPLDGDQQRAVTQPLLEFIVGFSKPRLDTYFHKIDELVRELRKLKSQLPEAYKSKNLEDLLTWLNATICGHQAPSEEGWSLLAEECHQKRKESFFEVLRHISEFVRDPNEKDKIEQLFKQLCKLGKPVALSEKFFKALFCLSNEFRKGFELEKIPFSGWQKIPIWEADATISAIIRKMPWTESKRQRFREKLTDLMSRERLETTMETNRKVATRVHAELALLDHLYCNEVIMLDLDEKYIGCSKPACYLCHAYIKKHPGGFVVPDSHQKLYIAWRPPGMQLQGGPCSEWRHDLFRKLKDLIRDKLDDEVDHMSTMQAVFRADSTYGGTTESGDQNASTDRWLEDQGDINCSPVNDNGSSTSQMLPELINGLSLADQGSNKHSTPAVGAGRSAEIPTMGRNHIQNRRFALGPSIGEPIDEEDNGDADGLSDIEEGGVALSV